MLVIADRGFFSFELWAEFCATSADLLFRISSHMKLPPIEILPDGSYLSVVNSKSTRSSGYQIPLSAVGDPRRATHIPVRVIEYTVTDISGQPGPEVFRLITTILDPDDLAATELAAAYHERWEYEIALKEIETQMLGPGGGLRSKSPELIRQELWGLLLAHYAIRSLMAEAAANQPGLIPTGCRSCEVSTSSAARSPTRRHFPPRRLSRRTGDGHRGDPRESQ